jgi:hypothetical protein
MDCACGAGLADDEAAIVVLGQHQHVATNPMGWQYTLRCFAAVRGVKVASNPSREWSWFPGYAWQIENCAGCGAHVGWKYLRLGGDESFHGLIVRAAR